MRRTGLIAAFSARPAAGTAALMGATLAGAALASWLVRFASRRGGQPNQLSEKPANGALRRWIRQRGRQAQPTAEAIQVAPARERSLAPEG